MAIHINNTTNMAIHQFIIESDYYDNHKINNIFNKLSELLVYIV